MALWSLPSSHPGQADQRRRPAVRGVARQLLAGRPAGLLKRRLQHQVLGRIAGEIKLRRHHDVGPKGGGLLARFAQPIAVARDVADDRRDLGERDDEAVGGGGHGGTLDARGCGRRNAGAFSRASIATASLTMEAQSITFS